MIGTLTHNMSIQISQIIDIKEVHVKINYLNTMLKACIYIGAFSPPERPKRRNLPIFTSDTVDDPYDAM